MGSPLRTGSQFKTQSILGSSETGRGPKNQLVLHLLAWWGVGHGYLAPVAFLMCCGRRWGAERVCGGTWRVSTFTFHLSLLTLEQAPAAKAGPRPRTTY